MRCRIGSLSTAQAQIAIRIGARYSIRSAIPIGSRPIETKYSHWTSATPATPKATRYGSSRRVSRRLCRRETASTSANPRKAPVARTCVSSSDEIPDWSTTLDTVPFSAKRSAAEITIT
jgi:hypothetical protein